MRQPVTALRRRPRNFESLCGQPFVAQSLRDSVLSGTVGNAYLFSGPHGVGKTSAARLLAAALHGSGRLGTKKSSTKASSEKESLKDNAVVYADWWITGTSLVDVIEIDGASHTGVNDIRTIREQVLYPPIEYPYKVYIIDEVHMLSQSAFNALLKTIEEPPSYIVFIFATTELERVPATIRSRCQQFQFQLIRHEDLVASLEDAAKEEGIPIQGAASALIAQEAKGSLRDLYMLFDQLKPTASKAGITEQLVLEQLGLHDIFGLRKMAALLVSGDKAKAQAFFQELLSGGTSASTLVNFFMRLFRSLYYAKLDIATEGLDFFGIEASQAEQYSAAQCEYALKRCLETHKEIHYSDFASIEVELLLAELSTLQLYMPLPQIVSELQRLAAGAPLHTDPSPSLDTGSAEGTGNKYSSEESDHGMNAGANAPEDARKNIEMRDQRDENPAGDTNAQENTDASKPFTGVRHAPEAVVPNKGSAAKGKHQGVATASKEDEAFLSSTIETVITSLPPDEERNKALHAITRLWKESIQLHIEVADYFMYQILQKHKLDIVSVLQGAIGIEDFVIHIRISEERHNKTLLAMQPILQGKIIKNTTV